MNGPVSVHQHEHSFDLRRRQTGGARHVTTQRAGSYCASQWIASYCAAALRRRTYQLRWRISVRARAAWHSAAAANSSRSSEPACRRSGIAP